MLRQIPTQRIQGLLHTGQELTAMEVAQRRADYGPNDILTVPAHGWMDLARDTLRDPMLWFLVLTSTLFLVIGEYKEAFILAVAILPLAGMDVYLHHRTAASTASLSGRLMTHCQVRRDKQVQRIPCRELVVGDLVMLASGDSFPADGVIVAGTTIKVDESVLTGEAFPASKHPYELQRLHGESPSLPAEHWGFAGTRVLTGSLQLRVIFTGNDTYYGGIITSAVRGQHGKTPLQTAIGSLVNVLLVTATIMCLLVASVRWLQGFGLLDAIVSAVTLAVAALPEEFPIVFTFFLGVGVYRLAKRQALVRRAVAVENIARVTTICTDKTGTLTHGQLNLTHRYPVSGLSDIELLRVAALASRIDSNDPLDNAIFIAAGNHPQTHPHLATFPFTEDRKRETVILRYNNDELLIACKGAPETILAQCSLTEAAREQALTHAAQLAGAGHKVIACAQQRLSLQQWDEHEPVSNFEFAGMLAFEDPVRGGVAESIQHCQRAGIHIIMITGDHPATARSVAREIGLGHDAPRVVTAAEYDALRATGVANPLSQIDVVARCVPAQKLNLVKQLQDAGEVVAVTGDGVNDVPALQHADVGIAMGERGTQAAREVAALVLLDDNFRTIVNAIAEGHQLFQNLRLSFAYLLMIHIPLVVSAAVIPLAGFPLLYLPIHVVWLELLIHPTALLVFQQLPRQDGLLPRRTTGPARIFSRWEWVVIALVGLLLTLVLVGGYIYSLGSGRDVEHARAMALAILCLGSGFITAMLSRLTSRSSIVIVLVTVISAACLIQLPSLAVLLHLAPLHLADWAIAALGSLAIAALVNFARFQRKAY